MKENAKDNALLDEQELSRLYDEAETVDKSIFAEQRSNVLLVAGDHYNSLHNPSRDSSVRDSKSSTEKAIKLRLTKNHSYRLHKRYVRSILANASGVRITPRVDYELAHQKTAELYQSVWEYIKDTCKIKEKQRRWASDFATLGECFVKVFWDNEDGEIVGYQAQQNEMGEDLVDEETGSLVPDNQRPVFAGKLKFERIFGFNLLRDPQAKELEESPYLIYRKLVKTSVLKKRYSDRDDVLRAINDGTNDEYIVFDTNTYTYSRSKGYTTLREFYFKPCMDYPNGYYYIAVKGAVLESGELPEGVMPIRFKTFDENQTSPRGRSFLKQARPYQAEINRASSTQALHQITIGDDKILYQSGTKLEPGALLPGVRGITYNGQPPTILNGRDGSQYQPYIQGQITEMYDVLDANDLFSEKINAQSSSDMHAMLFRSAAQKQLLSEYAEKFEEFMGDIAETAITLAKAYFPDDMLIPAIGKNEMINIAEFRIAEKLHTRIKVVPQDDSLETQFGKQLAFQHLLQYAGTQLEKQDIGLLMRSMPYSNAEEQFKEYTTDYDDARNLLLALDRGEYPESIADQNHEYIVKKLTSRILQADFKMLAQDIQLNYENKRQEHMQFAEEQRQKLLAAQSEYIPSDGPMIACDVYVEDQTDPNKAPKRARIPQNALNWLMEKLEAQKGPILDLQDDTLGQLNAMEQMGQQGQGMPPNMMGGSGNMQGEAMPNQPMPGVM